MSEQSPLRTILKQPGFPQVKPLSDTLSVQSSDDKTVDLIKYQKNLEELRNTLSQIDSLLAEPATPEITARCASLLGYIAAIDLPAEIKNQEAGRYPPQVQAQVSRTLESSDKVETGTQAAQAAAYSAAIMQRVSEEAQIRIQQQATLAVETSRMTFENFMRESDANIAKMQRDFLNSPYSKESEDQLIAKTAAEYNKLKKEIERDGQIFINNFENMSPEEQKKAVEERERQTQQMEADRIKHEQKAQQWRERALQCPKGSAERNTYMAMVKSEEERVQCIAECISGYNRYTMLVAEKCRMIGTQVQEHESNGKTSESNGTLKGAEQSQSTAVYGSNKLVQQFEQGKQQNGDGSVKDINAVVRKNAEGKSDNVSKSVVEDRKGAEVVSVPNVPMFADILNAKTFNLESSQQDSATLENKPRINQMIANNSQGKVEDASSRDIPVYVSEKEF